MTDGLFQFKCVAALAGVTWTLKPNFSPEQSLRSSAASIVDRGRRIMILSQRFRNLQYWQLLRQLRQKLERVVKHTTMFQLSTLEILAKLALLVADHAAALEGDNAALHGIDHRAVNVCLSITVS